MTVTMEHRARVLANQQAIVDAGEAAAALTDASTIDELVAAWFDHCDHKMGEPRKVLQDAYYRRLAQLTGAAVP